MTDVLGDDLYAGTGPERCDSFDMFYARTTAKAVTVARTYAFPQWQLGDDAAQEAYIRLLGRWPERQDKTFTVNRNFLLAIIVNEVRRLQGRTHRETFLYDWPTSEPVAADSAAGITGQLWLHAFLISLPPGERAVGVLYTECGMTPSEIAEVLRITPSTTRTHLQRLRAKAQQYLQGEGRETDD